MSGEVLEPDLLGLVVGGEALGGITAKVRGVEPVLGEHVHLREELPRPPDGLLLEKVAEGPVPEHLEEGVVVGVLADVVEVVVLTARADALLGVGGALELRERALRVGGAQEAGLELVHSRVGEEEGWVIVGDHGRGRHDGVLLALEEIQKGLPDPLGGPLLHGVHGWSVEKWVSGHGRVSGSGRRFEEAAIGSRWPESSHQWIRPPWFRAWVWKISFITFLAHLFVWRKTSSLARPDETGARGRGRLRK